MRIPALIAITVTLCSLSTGCKPNDTEKSTVWVPAPRLSVAVDWTIEHDTACSPIRTEAQAVSMVVAQPRCRDVAIEALKNFSERDANAMSDLAAAYYIRAEKNDRPADYLSAFDAARRAVETKPQPAGARFNLALAEEALGMTADAIRDWTALQSHDPEARRHRENLERELEQGWSREKLSAALAAGNVPEVKRLARRHPESALYFLEGELLPDKLPQARLLAEQLTQDRFALDEVEACSPALEGAYAALRGARSTNTSSEAARKFSQTAHDEFHKNNNPVALATDIVKAMSEESVEDLINLERQTRARGYLTLTARALSARGYVSYPTDYLGALSSYEAAEALYTQLDDAEGVAMTHTRHAGILRIAGQLDAGWREVLQTCRHLFQLGRPTDRVLLLGEAAALAFALDHPHAALRYADEALAIARQDLIDTPPEYEEALERGKRTVARALSRRAQYRLNTDDIAGALQDIGGANRLSDEDSHPEYRRLLDAHSAEIEAQVWMRTGDLRRAIALYTKAIDLSEGLEYISYRAVLLTQRAKAKHLANLRVEAERDLVDSLATLDVEEKSLLKDRKVADADQIVWDYYFSRFQETYRDLIRQYIESGQASKAFLYADRARAYEPLNLALKLRPAPDAPKDLDIEGVQRRLPPGTFLIEYTALADFTYAWVISHDGWRILTLKDVGQKTLEHWNDALRSAVPTVKREPIEAALRAAYASLVAEPLKAIAGMPGGASPRIVIIPDGAMYGLPFAALQDPDTNRYLIEAAPVSTAGSAALYLLSLQRDAALPRDATALLIGDPLNDLPGARDEVRALAAGYGQSATRLTGKEATAEAFITGIGNHAIVHVAAHGEIDPLTPSRSLLHFSAPLDAAQMLKQLRPGRARLVVLAACSSAGGVPAGAQGVGPLVRPLIANGVPVVIGTLWNIKDATVERLLVSFHQHYRKGDDAAVAMQKAQIELLSDKTLPSVLASAPFQVIGYGSSPFAPSR